MGIFQRFTTQGQRERARASAPVGPLRDYYDVRLPGKDTPLNSLPMLALDLETTGLDANAEHIVSIGWVPIDGLAIQLGGARRVLVKPNRDIGQSAVFHGITHDQLEGGIPLAEALESTLAALQGRIMVAHYAPIERRFLANACSNVYGTPVRLPAIDTMRLQRHLLRGGGASDATMTAQGTLRLHRARDRYHLPRYRAHDALLDAISAAELLLAQVAELSPDGSISSEALRKLN